MKVLVFHIGVDRYGLRLAQIVRVLPLLELKSLPGAPASVAGLMDLHGVSVPVIEMSRLAGLPGAFEHFDTRIVIVEYRAPGGAVHAPSEFGASGVTAAPFLGQVASDADGIIQLVELADLLPPALCAILFQPAGGAA
jgi:chemotaxis-related protein WspB